MPVDTFAVDDLRRDIDVSRVIAQLTPDDSGLAVILMNARKEPTKTAEFHHFEDDVNAYWTQINNATGYNAVDTNIVVDDASIFKPKDILKNARTSEQMLVTAVNAGTNMITVTRAYGSTSAAAMNDNDWIVRLGNAMEEGSNAPEPNVKQPTKVTNYTQIVRTPFDETMTSEAESRKTVSERVRLRRQKALEHRLAIERICLFGEKKEDVLNKRRTTAGILAHIQTNVYNASSELTEQEFETSFCEPLFRYGSSSKLLVASSRVLSAINYWAKGKLQIVPKDKTYGVQIIRYLSAHGELNIVKSKTLEKGYAGWAVGIDLENIVYRPLQGRDTKLKTNIQANDLDGWKDEYLTEFGMQVKLEKTHAVLKGVTTFK
ncbi:MAG TPA: DUF5309 domain-containing protein [Firmicutes bacterium]|nr:DUF5309 domain-containing protein [Candidatus Fermentithermobacillaceae bacterium]